MRRTLSFTAFSSTTGRRREPRPRDRWRLSFGGTVLGGAALDGTDLGGMQNCADLNAGAANEPLLCNDSCGFDLSNCSGCGDGTITPPEDCEPATPTSKADLGGATCEQLFAFSDRLLAGVGPVLIAQPGFDLQTQNPVKRGSSR